MELELGKDAKASIEKVDGKIKLSVATTGEIEVSIAVAVTADHLCDDLAKLIPGDSEVEKLAVEALRAFLKK